MRHHLPSVHDESGAPTVWGLAVLAFLLIPIAAILMAPSQSVNTSQVAQNLSYSVAYGALNRSIDLDATAAAGATSAMPVSPQLTWDRTTVTGSRVYQDVTNVVQSVSNETLGAEGGRFSLVPFPDRAPQRPDGASSNGTVPVSIVNVLAEPATNRVLRDQGALSYPGVPEVLVSPVTGRDIVAWTDSRATDANGRFVAMSPGQDVNSQWTHYTSGAQAKIRFDLNTGIFGQVRGERRGVATFGRPCEPDQPTCDQ